MSHKYDNAGQQRSFNFGLENIENNDGYDHRNDGQTPVRKLSALVLV